MKNKKFYTQKDLKDLIERKDHFVSEAKKYREKYHVWQFFGWIAIIITVVIILSIIYTNIQEKAYYKITQEECHNETPTFDSGDNFFCEDGSRGFINKSEFDLHWINSSCFTMNGNEEVCEQKEVEKIPEYTIYNFDSLEGLNDTIKFWENTCIDNYKINKEECDKYPRYFNLKFYKLKEFLENIKKDKRFVGKKNKEDNFSPAIRILMFNYNRTIKEKGFPQ